MVVWDKNPPPPVGNRVKGRDQYIVSKKFGQNATIQKLHNSKFMSRQYIVPLDKLFTVTDSLKDSLSYGSRLKGKERDYDCHCDTDSSDDFPVPRQGSESNNSDQEEQSSIKFPGGSNEKAQQLSPGQSSLTRVPESSDLEQEEQPGTASPVSSGIVQQHSGRPVRTRREPAWLRSGDYVTD